MKDYSSPQIFWAHLEVSSVRFFPIYWSKEYLMRISGALTKVV